MTTPPTTTINVSDTHRLIPSRYSESGDSVLARIADSSDHLNDIFELDHATNDRLLAENNRHPGIGLAELVSRVPYYRIINAAFTHAHPLGSRFNGPDRSAWYAGFELETAQKEVAFHKSVELSEIAVFDESITYEEYLADFDGDFHDIRNNPSYSVYLDPDSYIRSQELGRILLDAASLGICYPSVRHSGGTCMACFRPALVSNVRKYARYRLTWDGDTTPSIDIEEVY